MHRQPTIIQSTENSQFTLPEGELNSAEIPNRNITNDQYSYEIFMRYNPTDDLHPQSLEVLSFADNVNSHATDITSLSQGSQGVNFQTSIHVESCRNSPHKQGVNTTFSGFSPKDE